MGGVTALSFPPNHPLQVSFSRYRSMNNSIPTIVTVQKFLSAFLDRLSKAKQSLESATTPGSEVNDLRQLSTRVIQQWNALFPNSPIHSADSVSTNTLIATKTRDEVVIDRSNQQKQKLLMEVEVLRAKLQEQQQEVAHLQEEITKCNTNINVGKASLQQLEQQRSTLITTLSSLQTQKVNEESDLRALQAAKLTLLEELVSLQKAREADTVSVQALRIEKEEQSKVLEQLQNESLLLTREIEAVRHQQEEVNEAIQQQKLELSTSSANQSSTLTRQLPQSDNSENSTMTTPRVGFSPEQDIAHSVYFQWSVIGMRKRMKRKQRLHGIHPAGRLIPVGNGANLFDDDSFW